MLLSCSNIYRQKTSDTNKVHDIVKIEVEFPGGNVHVSQYIQMSLRHPVVAKLVGINGKVRVGFTVGADGILRSICALDSIATLFMIKANHSHIQPFCYFFYVSGLFQSP